MLRLLCGERFECLLVDIRRPHGGAFVGKGNRRRPSNSLSCGRNHSGLSRQPSTHPIPLFATTFDSNLQRHNEPGAASLGCGCPGLELHRGSEQIPKRTPAHVSLTTTPLFLRVPWLHRVRRHRQSALPRRREQSHRPSTFVARPRAPSTLRMGASKALAHAPGQSAEHNALRVQHIDAAWQAPGPAALQSGAEC